MLVEKSSKSVVRVNFHCQFQLSRASENNQVSLLVVEITISLAASTGGTENVNANSSINITIDLFCTSVKFPASQFFFIFSNSFKSIYVTFSIRLTATISSIFGDLFPTLPTHRKYVFYLPTVIFSNNNHLNTHINKKYYFFIFHPIKTRILSLLSLTPHGMSFRGENSYLDCLQRITL
jgi:hypothetical protein